MCHVSVTQEASNILRVWAATNAFPRATDSILSMTIVPDRAGRAGRLP